MAQKMLNAAVVKARELGVAENVAILDDGGNLKAFSQMDGALIPTIEMAQNKAYTALFGVSTQFFQLYPGRPVALGWHSRALAHCCVVRRVSDQGKWRTRRGERRAYGAKRY